MTIQKTGNTESDDGGRPKTLWDQCSPSHSSSFDVDGLMSKMRELQKEIEKWPNVFVMTRNTLEQLRQQTESQRQGFVSGAMPTAFMGTPIEDYATVKECMDRMMEPRKGERLQLVISEDLPVDCIDHPWMKKQIGSLADRFGFEANESGENVF